MVITNVAEILGFGTPELLIILVIALLIFGGKKLPELARSVGQSAKELRNGLNGIEEAPVSPTPASTSSPLPKQDQ